MYSSFVGTKLSTKRVLSKVSPPMEIAVLHVSGRVKGRLDLTGWNEILQASIVRIPKGKLIKPHKHLPIQRETLGTQETWIVQRGRGLATFYDLNGSKLVEIKVSRGAVVLLLRGGHSLRALSRRFTIVEVKNGPYRGGEIDKASI